MAANPSAGSVGPNRLDLADIIIERIETERSDIASRYARTRPDIGHFIVDDLLPEEVARALFRAFPKPETMKLKKTLREYKFIAAQMNNYDPVLEEAIYAFQDPRVVALIQEICGLKSVYPDEHLYAGGISMMGPAQYLNPHLDNSHDKEGARWRVLNLLYYVTEDWAVDNGGNLELWPGGVGAAQTTIHSKFNRLVVMATHGGSWHSVSPIRADGFRCCISNYYFSDEPLRQDDAFHVTSFRGRPEQPARDVALRVDAALRMSIRKVLPKGVGNKSHVYRRDESAQTGAGDAGERS